jgi:hypothetical protein
VIVIFGADAEVCFFMCACICQGVEQVTDLFARPYNNTRLNIREPVTMIFFYRQTSADFTGSPSTTWCVAAIAEIGLRHKRVSRSLSAVIPKFNMTCREILMALAKDLTFSLIDNNRCMFCYEQLTFLTTRHHSLVRKDSYFGRCVYQMCLQ